MRRKVLAIRRRPSVPGRPLSMFERLKRLQARVVGLGEENLTLRKKASLLEDELRSVIENIQDVFYRSDNEGRLVLASPSALDFFGYDSLEECLGKPVAETFYRDPEKRAELVRLVREKGRITNYEAVLKRKDGTPLVVNMNSHLYYDTDRRVAGIEGILRDVTASRRAEDALIASEHRMKEIVDGLPIPQFVLDENRRIILWNRALEEYSGLRAEEMVGTDQHWRAFYKCQRPCLADLLVAGEIDAISKLYGGKFSRSPLLDDAFEVTDFFPDLHGGTWMYLTAAPLWDAGGRVIGAVETLMDVNERVRAEEALRKSEANMRMLIENQQDLLVKVDAEGRFLFVSPSYCRTFGKTEEELLGSNFMPLVHEEDRETTARAMEALYRPPYTAYMEQRAMTQDGWRWLAWKDTAVLDGNGRIQAITGLGRDITERKRAEAALHTSQQELRRNLLFLEGVLSAIPTPVFYKDTQDRYLGCNRAYTEVMGLKPEDLKGKTPYELWPTEFSDVYARTDLELLAHPGGQSYEAKVIDGKGEIRDVVFRKDVFRNEDGSVGGIIGAFFDVTERLRAERALQENEERYRMLFDAESDAIVLIDTETLQHLDANTAALNLYGYTREEMLALRSTDISAEPEATSQQVHTGERILHVSMRNHRKKDGTVFPVEITGRFFEWQGRRCLLEAIRDITERIRAEEQHHLLESRLLQGQKMESVGRLAGGIAHDFNNMLTPILAYASMLQDDFPKDDPRQNSVEQILKAADRSKDLVRQLLAFARKQTLEMKPLDLNKVVGGFEKMLRRTIHENIILDLNLPPGLPPIKADIGQIEQVILNLAVNAQDAMPGGGHLLIETSEVALDDAYSKGHEGVSPGTYVLMTVSDTGCGMSKETLDRIFEPFFTTKGQGKGIGLGMATVYGILKQHGGHISVYSEPGMGTVFRVYFPACGEALAADGAPSAPEPPPTGRETILVVEDQEQVRTLTVSVLRRYGYQVLTAESLEAAKAAAASHGGELHLLVTDVILPDGNGRQLHQWLAESRPAMKVLYMSGYTSDVISHHGVLEAGIHFIQKPFTIQGFTRKVREVLDD